MSRRGFLAGMSGAAAAIATGAHDVGAAPLANAPTGEQPVAATPDLDQIQGNVLAGFGTDLQAFVFVSFRSAAGGRSWLTTLTPWVTSTRRSAAIAVARQVAVAAGGAPEPTVQVNVALSHLGLVQLGRPTSELRRFPDEFREGMRRRADVLGDRGVGDPSRWADPYRRPIHAVVLIGADDAASLEHELEAHRALARSAGIDVVRIERGATRADEPGHEHFGFRDGISQPGIRGITPQRNPANPDQGVPGQDLLWPGEFVLGYPRQFGPGGDGEAAGPIARSGPTWTDNGSYLVFRRLRQDVAGFRAFVSAMAAQQGITDDLAGAKLVGRYRSGAPLELTGPVSSDPGVTDPSLLDDLRINDFEFADDDPTGEVVPVASHIRKMYPRDSATDEGGEDDTQTHRLLRRGIPFGTSLPGDTPLDDPAATASFPDDRGLLFLCYQSSIARQFEFVQRRWANDPDGPVDGVGHDPLIGQVHGARSFTLPGGRPDHVALMQQFVVTTGGEYFFQPSIAALRDLGAGAPPTGTGGASSSAGPRRTTPPRQGPPRRDPGQSGPNGPRRNRPTGG